MLTVAWSQSARPHSFRLLSATLISIPARDQTPFHPLATGHGALWTTSNSATYKKDNNASLYPPSHVHEIQIQKSMRYFAKNWETCDDLCITFWKDLSVNLSVNVLNIPSFPMVSFSPHWLTHRQKQLVINTFFVGKKLCFKPIFKQMSKYFFSFINLNTSMLEVITGQTIEQANFCLLSGFGCC